jgi:hypothetical protein
MQAPLLVDAFGSSDLSTHMIAANFGWVSLSVQCGGNREFSNTIIPAIALLLLDPTI